MRKYSKFCLFFCLLAFSIYQFSSQPILAQEKPAKSSGPGGKGTAQTVSESPPQEKISVTHHSVQIHGQTLDYTATAGSIPLKDGKDKLEAQIFFVSYVKEGAGDKSSRPVTFAFDGGPGSSSIWLHLGALGPHRVLLTEEGEDAGHQMYTHLPSLKKLKGDVATFFKKALAYVPN